MQKLAGIEIGGTKLQLCIADEQGSIGHTLRYSVNANEGAEAIRNQILSTIKELPGIQSVETIGIGFGGPVDAYSGIVRTSHQVPGWANFPLKMWLEQTTGKHVVVDNDANVAALGEATQGVGKAFNRVFYMTVGSGVGGGFVIDGNIYHGLAPGEMEVGHIRLEKNGATLESRCSGWAVDKRIRTFIERNPATPFAKRSENNNNPGAYLLGAALEQEDEHAKKIMDEIIDDLAFALSHVVHLLHPDILVIGGGLSLLGRHLLLPLRKRLPSYVMEAFHPAPPIELPALGELVVPIGAIELAKASYQQKSKTKTNT